MVGGWGWVGGSGGVGWGPIPNSGATPIPNSGATPIPNPDLSNYLKASPLPPAPCQLLDVGGWVGCLGQMLAAVEASPMAVEASPMAVEALPMAVEALPMAVEGSSMVAEASPTAESDEIP